MERKKILFLNNKDIWNPASGGGTQLIFRLMNTLSKRNHSITLLCGKFPGSKEHEWINGMKIIRKGGLFTTYPFTFLNYLRESEKERFDLVIDCALQGVPFFSPLYVRSPIIALFFHLEKEVFFHEMPLELGGRLASKVMGNLAYAIESGLVPILYRKVLKITFSESTRRDMIKTGYRGTIEVLQEGINLAAYGPSKRKADDPLLVYLGRLRRYKGVDDAIRAMKLVVREFPDAKLSIVGRGRYEGELRSLTKRLGICKNVVFHGYVDEHEKIRILQRAHILIMPSYREGWATPVIEANACGTPAVVSDAMGVAETVMHGETGFVYPLRDVEKMAEFIGILLRDESVRDRFYYNVLKWAKQFEWKASEERFVSICEEMMGLDGKG
ncbi:MAG: glycosyltransferase family 4 protein [Thermoplasmata archaeon]